MIREYNFGVKPENLLKFLSNCLIERKVRLANSFTDTDPPECIISLIAEQNAG